jgi:tetraprenyl-beta-curcumene synthase
VATRSRDPPWTVRSNAVSVFGDRRLLIRAGVALVLANARYWPTVTPLVRAQLSRWGQRAQAIPDPALRALALQKLRQERFNAEVATTLATLPPRAYRASAVEAIVAFEVMYDYLDGLTETPSPDPLHNGRQLFGAFINAVTPHAPADGDYYLLHPRSQDGGYLEELAAAVSAALTRLPAAAAIAQVAPKSAARCGEAQVRIHAVPSVGSAQLERWARREAARTDLDWREYAAGAASSVLAVHALIAAAADRRTTPEQAAQLDTVYLSICTLSTILDSLIDYERDAGAGHAGYIQYYDNRDVLARALANVVQHAAGQAKTLPHAAHHMMTLVGVVAYYTSAPGAGSELARSVAVHVQQQLRPIIAPTLAVMRTWRLAKRARLWWKGNHA